ncbi:MAG TPA: DUF4126 domain-containing protein [Rubrobacteraceae bacterium]|nr:DUF4126 domain-containing protein [Rubrobacteraceae bacterium]
MESLFALGIGIGIASVAGVRAFAPLALAALILGVLVSPPEALRPLSVGMSAIGALFALAVLESVLDKFSALERPLNWAMVPVRAAVGAVLFAATMALESPGTLAPWLIAGALVAGAVAISKVYLRPSVRRQSAGVSPTFLSVCEDLVGVAGGALAFFVPYLPALLVAFLLLFYYRVRKRRGRKFGGLRILGD